MFEQPRRTRFELGALARDVLASRQGDTLARARLVRSMVPAAARALLPQFAPVVDAASSLYDELVAPVARPGYGGTRVSDAAFWRWAASIDDGVIVALGSPRTGKTALLCSLAELWADTAPGGLFCVGVPASALKGTPLAPFEWSMHNLARLPTNSVLIIPDAGLYLDARAWGEGPEEVMRRLVILSGQRSCRIAADAQYSALIARSLLSTRALIYKPMGPTFMSLERSALRPLAEGAQEALAGVGGSLEQLRGFAYAYCDEIGYAGLIHTAPPPWYSAAISNSHRFDDLADGRVIDAEPSDIVAAPRRGSNAPGRPPRGTAPWQ